LPVTNTDTEDISQTHVPILMQVTTCYKHIQAKGNLQTHPVCSSRFRHVTNKVCSNWQQQQSVGHCRQWQWVTTTIPLLGPFYILSLWIQH